MATAPHAHYAVVYGVPVDTPPQQKLAKRVILISSLMSLIALVSVVLQLVSGFYFSIGILSAVIIPLCGYCGVLKRSRILVSCFTVCNCIIATLFIASFIATTSVTGGDYVACACDEECRTENDIPASTARHVCANQGRYRALYWAAMGCAFLMAALQCAGCFYGAKLLRTHWFITSRGLPSGAPVVGTYTYAAQPHGYHPPIPTATAPPGPVYQQQPYPGRGGAA